MCSKKGLILKRLIPAALAILLCLSGPGICAYDDLLVSEEGGSVRYNTVTVRRGDYVMTQTEITQLHYPIGYDLKFENDEARFVEYKVNHNDQVKAGDVLAEFIVDSSSVEVQRLELQVTRTQEETERGVKDREEQISEAKKLRARSTGYGWERQNLEVQRQQLELERYQFQQEHKLEQTRKELEKAKEEASDVLVAPMDGIVTYRCPKSPNDPVSSDEILITLCSEDVVYLSIVNNGFAYRYNMPVSFFNGQTGRVVADSVLSYGAYGVSEGSSVGALIQMDQAEGETPLKNSAVGEIVAVRDVLLIPRNALNAEGADQKFYVNRLAEDGTVQKRYVNVIWDRNLSDAWALEGVFEGDTLIVG